MRNWGSQGSCSLSVIECGTTHTIQSFIVFFSGEPIRLNSRTLKVYITMPLYHVQCYWSKECWLKVPQLIDDAWHSPDLEVYCWTPTAVSTVQAGACEDTHDFFMQEVLSLNLGWDTAYPDWGSLCFSYPFQYMLEKYLS
jgi:hypothetical protein